MAKLAPFAPDGIDHLLLLVHDMKAAVDFYQMVVGATVASRLPEYGMAMLDAGAGQVALVDWRSPEGAWARPEVAGGRNIDHFALSIATADEVLVRGHLAAQAVEIVEEMQEDGRLSLYVKDPSGNTVELRLAAAGA